MTMKTTDNIPFDDYAAAWQEESRRIRQLTEGVGTEGTGLAFMNRLLRSAGFRVEYL